MDIQVFNGNNVRLNLKEGQANLKDVALCCGLTKNANSGRIIVNWKSGLASVVKKIKHNT